VENGWKPLYFRVITNTPNSQLSANGITEIENRDTTSGRNNPQNKKKKVVARKVKDLDEGKLYRPARERERNHGKF